MPAYLGHTPLARIVLSAIVLLLVVQAATGLVLAGTDVYMPPLGGYFAEQVAADTHDPALVRPYAPETVNADAYTAMRAFRAPVVSVHELTFFLLANTRHGPRGGGRIRGAQGRDGHFGDVHGAQDPRPGAVDVADEPKPPPR